MGISLNNLPTTELSHSETLSKKELKWQIWAVNNIGELIASAPCLPLPLPKESVAKSVRASIDLVAEGNVAAFARILGMPKSTVWGWNTGKVLPQLNMLLKICHCLNGISLVDFLSQMEIPATVQTTHIHFPKQRNEIRVTPRSFDSNQVQEALLAVLASCEGPSPTMQKVANCLGYDRRTLSRHFLNST